ncbi:hypothetical protein Q5P01_002909 [Channa striata]|uniref:Uncharacterized protein n=1 Tax=Channa striata TaxID=64152 RepID=A0AA88NNE4_CHASR|nr:hypothetical protein Q5P01_002909 [Channa striata]
MKVLSLSITFCSILTLSWAMPLNSTLQMGQCVDRRQNCSQQLSSLEFCPKCDDKGNFIPLQCSRSTGYCWCVNVITGQEIPNTLKPPESAPDCDGDSADCPAGWSSFGKRCFIFIDSPKSWVDAEVYCQFDKANLASVHSHEESRFVISLTEGDNFPQTWLGGFDAVDPGFWMWSDGSNFNYRNWFDDDSNDNDNKDNDDNGEGGEEHDGENEDSENNDHDVNHDKGDENLQNDDDRDQSNHVKHEDIYDEDGEKSCLKMNYEHGLNWFYTSCRDSLPFVCVKKIRSELFD